MEVLIGRNEWEFENRKIIFRAVFGGMWRNNRDRMFLCFGRNNASNITDFKDLVNKEE